MERTTRTVLRLHAKSLTDMTYEQDLIQGNFKRIATSIKNKRLIDVAIWPQRFTCFRKDEVVICQQASSRTVSRSREQRPPFPCGLASTTNAVSYPQVRRVPA